MSQGLRPYPEYKDSGLPWLGQIPAHWNLRRAKYLYNEVDERSVTGKEQLCSVSHKTGVTPRKDSVTMFMAESTVGYKICRPNDLAINTLWAWMAALGIARQVGVVSPAYGVYRPVPGSELLPDFAERLLRIEEYKAEYMARSTGVNASRLRLYPDQFLRIPLLLPSRDEQKAIALYLDERDRLSRHFVRNRRRLIEVLNEQKRAIIREVLARRASVDVAQKPSGVDWFPKVPQHWSALKIKRVARVNPPRTEAVDQRTADAHVVFLPMERVSADGQVDMSESRPIREVWQGFSYFRRGDVVVAKITPCFENGKGACLTGLPTEIGFGTTEFIVLRPSDRVSADYLYQLTMLPEFRQRGVESMTGAAGQQRVSPEFVADFSVPMPPRDEQDATVAQIREESATLTALIARVTREIELIQEYRTRLIADAVTGKVDLRGFANATTTVTDEPIDAAVDENEPNDEESELVEEAVDAAD